MITTQIANQNPVIIWNYYLKVFLDELKEASVSEYLVVIGRLNAIWMGVIGKDHCMGNLYNYGKPVFRRY